MYNQRDILTFFYQDEYGVQQEFRSVDITGMSESQINATKARMFGQMHDHLQSEGYDTESIPDSEPMTDYEYAAKLELELSEQHMFNDKLRFENDHLRRTAEILKELLRKAYGN